jgi:hypothetical protein
VGEALIRKQQQEGGLAPALGNGGKKFNKTRVTKAPPIGATALKFFDSKWHSNLAGRLAAGMQVVTVKPNDNVNEIMGWSSGKTDDGAARFAILLSGEVLAQWHDESDGGADGGSSSGAGAHAEKKIRDRRLSIKAGHFKQPGRRGSAIGGSRHASSSGHSGASVATEDGEAASRPNQVLLFPGCLLGEQLMLVDDAKTKAVYEKQKKEKRMKVEEVWRKQREELLAAAEMTEDPEEGSRLRNEAYAVGADDDDDMLDGAAAMGGASNDSQKHHQITLTAGSSVPAVFAVGTRHLYRQCCRLAYKHTLMHKVRLLREMPCFQAQAQWQLPSLVRLAGLCTLHTATPLEQRPLFDRRAGHHHTIHHDEGMPTTICQYSDSIYILVEGTLSVSFSASVRVANHKPVKSKKNQAESDGNNNDRSEDEGGVQEEEYWPPFVWKTVKGRELVRGPCIISQLGVDHTRHIGKHDPSGWPMMLESAKVEATATVLELTPADFLHHIAEREECQGLITEAQRTMKGLHQITVLHFERKHAQNKQQQQQQQQLEEEEQQQPTTSTTAPRCARKLWGQSTQQEQHAKNAVGIDRDETMGDDGDSTGGDAMSISRPHTAVPRQKVVPAAPAMPRPTTASPRHRMQQHGPSGQEQLQQPEHRRLHEGGNDGDNNGGDGDGDNNGGDDDGREEEAGADGGWWGTDEWQTRLHATHVTTAGGIVVTTTDDGLVIMGHESTEFDPTLAVPKAREAAATAKRTAVAPHVTQQKQEEEYQMGGLQARPATAGAYQRGRGAALLPRSAGKARDPVSTHTPLGFNEGMAATSAASFALYGIMYDQMYEGASHGASTTRQPKIRQANTHGTKGVRPKTGPRQHGSTKIRVTKGVRPQTGPRHRDGAKAYADGSINYADRALLDMEGGAVDFKLDEFAGGAGVAAQKGRGMAAVLSLGVNAQALALKPSKKKKQIRKTEKLAPNLTQFEAAQRRLRRHDAEYQR